MTDNDAPPPVAALGEVAIFLDFDGTLVALAERPDAISVSAQLPDLLARLSIRLGGRIAILSGRSLADLESYLAVPGLALCGSHGLERAGASAAPQHAPAGLADAAAAFAAFAAAREGILVEEKPAGLALHYRLAPQHEVAARTLAAEVAARTGLAVQPGKMVVELRPPGADKGDALRALMAEPPFAGARPVFVGDDLTDEDGFRAAGALGGAGVLVGAPRDSAARFRLPDVDAVHAWLAAGAAHG